MQLQFSYIYIYIYIYTHTHTHTHTHIIWFIKDNSYLKCNFSFPIYIYIYITWFIKDNSYLKCNFSFPIYIYIYIYSSIFRGFTRSDHFASSFVIHLPEDTKLVKTFDSCLSSLIKKISTNVSITSKAEITVFNVVTL